MLIISHMGERREIPDYIDRQFKLVAKSLAEDEETARYLYQTMVNKYRYARRAFGSWGKNICFSWAIGATIHGLIIEEESVKHFLNNRAKWEAEAEKLLAKT